MERLTRLQGLGKKAGNIGLGVLMLFAADHVSRPAVSAQSNKTSGVEASGLSINAFPNPVSDGPGLGKTTISADTGSSSNVGYMRVLETTPGAVGDCAKVETSGCAFTGAFSGSLSVDAPWIQTNGTYQFRLMQAMNVLSGPVTVTRPRASTEISITANPRLVPDGSGLGKTIISADTGSSSNVGYMRVLETTPGAAGDCANVNTSGCAFTGAFSGSLSVDAPWIQTDHTYQFRLMRDLDTLSGPVTVSRPKVVTPTPIPENCPNPINGNFYRVRACFTDSFGTRRLFGVDLAGDGTANAAIYNWNRDNNTFTNRIPVNAALNPDSDGIAIAGIVVDTAFDRTYLLEGADRPPFTNIYMARLEYFNTTHAITNPTDLSSHSVANSGLPQGGINGIPDGFTLTENSDSNGKYLRANIVNSVTSSENGSYDSRLTSGTGIPGTWSRVSTSSLSSEAKITLTPTRTATPKPTTTISFPNSVTGRRESFTVTPTPRGTVAIS